MSFWRQKSAVKWLQKGGANTKFFHSIVKQRRCHNYIARIKIDAGQWLEDEMDIKDLAEQFFTKMFSSKQENRFQPVLNFSLPTLSQEDNDML